MEDKFKYFDLRNEAWLFLIYNHITEYPLDLWKLLKNNNWEAISYQELGIITTKESDVKYIDNGKHKRIIIMYDKRIERKELRFYIAHEIGHIIMKHYGLSNMSIYEREAKMFAKRILMPITLIHNLKLFTTTQIMEKCEVTHYEAYWRLKRYMKDLVPRGKFGTSELEKVLTQQLKL